MRIVRSGILLSNKAKIFRRKKLIETNNMLKYNQMVITAKDCYEKMNKKLAQEHQLFLLRKNITAPPSTAITAITTTTITTRTTTTIPVTVRKTRKTR